MKNYNPVMSFDEKVAKTYGLRGDEAEAVAFLSELAGTGPALELAVGTGRLALPLAGSGVRVDGIDFSADMLAEMKRRPGGEKINAVLGDFVEVGIAGTYALIYVAWNSFFNVLSQGGQLRCFENVAAHLTAEGVFVIETFVPAYFYRLNDNQYVNAESIETDEVKLDLLRHDPVSQTIEENHVSLSAAGIGLNPVMQRYAWPAELDLMARIAGLRLKERWQDWRRNPFQASSEAHVSVYGRV